MMTIKASTLAMISIASITAVSTQVRAENSGYARFTHASDTIQILGNTQFPGTDWTYEMRIRLDPALLKAQERMYIISEQRDSYEGKMISIDGRMLAVETIRGHLCGDDALRSLESSLCSRWLHLAWVRSGSMMRLFVDGALDHVWEDRPSCTVDHPGSWMSIGMFRYGAGYIPTDAKPSFLGDLDWIRVSQGVRYTSEFTPPFECEITSDAQTQLLLKFNEPASVISVIDESSNQFVCNLGVPVFPGVVATAPVLGSTVDGFPSCPPLCDGDIEEDGSVDGIDLAIILSRWGTNPKDYPRADTNGDGVVNGADLAVVLGGWGVCP